MMTLRNPEIKHIDRNIPSVQDVVCTQCCDMNSVREVGLAGIQHALNYTSVLFNRCTSRDVVG